MKFDEKRKQFILLYLLDKIDRQDTSISKSVSEVFGVNQNTIHIYINELVEQNIIERVKRGQYKLIKNEYQYSLVRSNGDLDTDTFAYDNCLLKHIHGLASNVKAIWSYSFSEMINNIMDHSFAENVRIVIIQDYLKTMAIIIDDGIGIFKKIKDYFGFDTLDEAICELFKGKLTTDSENHSGEGIFFSSKMMDEFIILSSGKVFTDNNYDNNITTDIQILYGEGTCVLMSLSNFTNKKPQEVFDLYADVDGGFEKTKIPMKNIFDASPVSRSQAKRVCNRLDKFGEVILDFEDLQWMGQGFAHQIFVVFAREHPEIKLIPINMNEDITKMYHHVLSTKEA